MNDAKESVEFVKGLMNGHDTKWSNLPDTVNRSILYVPFNETQVKQPFEDQKAILAQVRANVDAKVAEKIQENPALDADDIFDDIYSDEMDRLSEPDEKTAALGEPNLIELAQDMADGKMLRTFMQEVQKRLPADDNDVNSFTIRSQWNKLSEEQQKEVLNKVVQKTPAILIRGQAPTHGNQPLPDGPLNLRPKDSIQVTGHGNRTSEEIAVVTKLDVGEVITAEEVVERLQEDLQNSDLKVPLNVAGAAPRIKLNCCGSSGAFHQAFAHAAQDAEMQVEVHAYDYDAIITLPPEYVINNPDKPNRYLEISAETPTPAMLTAAAKAAQQLSEQGHKTMLAAWEARPEAVQARLVEELEEKEEAASNAVTVAGLELSNAVEMEKFSQAPSEKQKYKEEIKTYKKELAEAEATLNELQQELRGAKEKLDELAEEELDPKLDALLTLNNALKEHEEQGLNALEGFSSDAIKNTPLSDLAAQLTEAAERLEKAPKVEQPKFKASEHRPFISVRDALQNNHPKGQPFTVQQSQRQGSKLSSSSSSHRG